MAPLVFWMGNNFWSAAATTQRGRIFYTSSTWLHQSSPPLKIETKRNAQMNGNHNDSMELQSRYIQCMMWSLSKLKGIENVLKECDRCVVSFVQRKNASLTTTIIKILCNSNNAIAQKKKQSHFTFPFCNYLHTVITLTDSREQIWLINFSSCNPNPLPEDCLQSGPFLLLSSSSHLRWEKVEWSDRKYLNTMIHLMAICLISYNVKS